jgi:hypothetical protein
MPRGRKNARAEKESHMCCGGERSSKVAAIGLVLIFLGLAIKIGWSLADLMFFIGIIFLVKGFMMSMMKK